MSNGVKCDGWSVIFSEFISSQKLLLQFTHLDSIFVKTIRVNSCLQIWHQNSLVIPIDGLEFSIESIFIFLLIK